MSGTLTSKSRAAESLAYEATVERGLDALTLLARLLRNDSEQASTQAGLSQPMALALGRLASLGEPTTVSELARALSGNMGNLSTTLDRLEEGGYIERLVGDVDRRARYLRLTAKGRRTAALMMDKFRNGRVCAAMKQMDTQQLQALTETIRRLNDAAKAQQTS